MLFFAHFNIRHILRAFKKHLPTFRAFSRMVGVLGNILASLCRGSLFGLVDIVCNMFALFLLVVHKIFFLCNCWGGEYKDHEKKTHEKKAVPASLDSSWPKANWNCFLLM